MIEKYNYYFYLFLEKNEHIFTLRYLTEELSEQRNFYFCCIDLQKASTKLIETTFERHSNKEKCIEKYTLETV